MRHRYKGSLQESIEENDARKGWILNYSDVMTLLLCFFIILFSIENASVEQIQIIFSSFRDSLGFFPSGDKLSQEKENKMKLRTNFIPEEDESTTLKNIYLNINSLLQSDKGNLKIKITSTEKGIVVSFIDAKFFNQGSSKLQTPLKEMLVKLSALFKDLEHFVRVEGHASLLEAELLARNALNSNSRDDVYDDTWELSSDRAIQVAQYLSKLGVNPYILQTVGFGHYRPLESELNANSPESAAYNQRIDIFISQHKVVRSKNEPGYKLPKTRLPGYDSLTPD